MMPAGNYFDVPPIELPPIALPPDPGVPLPPVGPLPQLPAGGMEHLIDFPAVYLPAWGLTHRGTRPLPLREEEFRFSDYSLALAKCQAVAAGLAKRANLTPPEFVALRRGIALGATVLRMGATVPLMSWRTPPMPAWNEGGPGGHASSESRVVIDPFGPVDPSLGEPERKILRCAQQAIRDLDIKIASGGMGATSEAVLPIAPIVWALLVVGVAAVIGTAYVAGEAVKGAYVLEESKAKQAAWSAAGLDAALAQMKLQAETGQKIDPTALTQIADVVATNAPEESTWKRVGISAACVAIGGLVGFAGAKLAKKAPKGK